MRRREAHRRACRRRPRGNARVRPGASAGRLADGRSPPRHRRIPGGDARAWMGRGRYPRNRVRLCGGSTRAAAGAGGRLGARPGSARRRIRLGCCRRGAGAHHGEAGRRRFIGRGRRRRREPRSTFRQSHRHLADDRSDGGEMGRGVGRAAPSSTRFGVVHDASLSNREQFENARRAAATLRREAISLEIESLDGLDAAIALARREAVAGLIFVSSPVFTANAARIVEAVRASGLPAVYESRWLVEKGGLMAYGPDFDAVFRRAASLADRLLKGARPADLPIEQPTRFQLQPQSSDRACPRPRRSRLSLLVRADEVIE